jgi:hypothetical protein
MMTSLTNLETDAQVEIEAKELEESDAPSYGEGEDTYIVSH